VIFAIRRSGTTADFSIDIAEPKAKAIIEKIVSSLFCDMVLNSLLIQVHVYQIEQVKEKTFVWGG
jgi:hypothetical protein